MCVFFFLNVSVTKRRSLNQKGRVRIIPVDSGMGVDDWEHKYKGQIKPQLSDFLDDDEENIVLRMGRSYPDLPNTTVPQNTQRDGFVPATYPESYDTIDRRRKKMIRDPGGLLSTERDKTREREETFPSDLALLREKRGELFMRQVAEMQEEEERMTSCLRPYKNGLLYKTRMWAKNELDNTLENYVAYKKEQDARMRARFDFDLEGPDDLQYSPGSEEDIDDIAFMAEDFHSNRTRHYYDRYSYTYDGHIENGQALREKKCGKPKIGGWATEAMLSPVEEPSDEYVDPMDELQCLVETVSEYLAEKEEEISKYGSLPKSSKSRLSSLGSNRTDSLGDDQKDPRGEPRSHILTDQNTSGVKNAMSSLFSSITEKVGGPKRPAPSPQAPSAQPSQSGLTKLFSFIPKSNSSAPVAVVSPVENSPEKSFSSLDFQLPVNGKTEGHSQETKSPHCSQNQTSTNEQVPEFVPKTQSTPQNTVFGKLNPLKLFSSAENIYNSPESTYTQGHSQLEGKHGHPGSQVTTTEEGKKFGKIRTSSQEKQLGQTQDENMHCRQNSTIKNENVPVSEPARPANQTQSANTGFFSPLKKSLNSLITPSVPVQPQAAPPLAVYPVFRSTEDPQVKKLVEDPSLSSRQKLPFLSSENVSSQQRPKTEGGMLSGFLKFASSEDVSSSVKTQNPVQSHHKSASITSTTLTQNPTVTQESTEKGWFSSIFNPTSPPTSSKQNICSNPQPQSINVPSGSHAQHISIQKPSMAQHEMQHQTPSQPESQGFLTGLFKGSSSDNISQPSPGGLLSGLLKFGSASDISGSSSQQPPQNIQPAGSSNLTQFPHHPPSQQHPSEKHRNNPLNNPSQQQQPSDQTQAQPQQKGLLSGLLKFTSSEKIPSSQTDQHQQNNAQQQPQNFSQQSNQGPSRGPSLSSRASSQQVAHQETSKPGFTRQQTVPLQQPPSQQGGLLSGLFKFSSADNINMNQPPQHHEISLSKSIHEQTTSRNNTISNENQPQNSSIQKTTGLLSGLFKSNSDNLAQQQQPRTIEETHQQIKVASTPEIQAETTGRSGVLSGLFNKLTKSSENADTTTQASTGQSLHRKSNNFTVTQTQIHTNLAQRNSKEHVTKEKIPRNVQQGFLSGLFSKNDDNGSCPTKQVETSSRNAEHQPHSAMSTDLPLGVLKSSSLDMGKDHCQRVISNSLNPGQSRHAMISVPSSIDSESLDLRTSATFARSLQSQPTYSSVSVGNLSQLYYSGSPLSVCSMAYSTGDIQSLLQNHAASSVMSMQPSLCGSNSSSYETRQNQYYISPYGISSSYDENQWISESIFWQQFQNESLNFQFQGGDQVYRQRSDSASFQASPLHHSFSNVYQPPNPSGQLQSVCHQEQIGPYHSDLQRNYDVCPKKKLWNSYEDLGNVQYSSNQDGVLNLTTNQSNGKFGNRGSTYSLNGVSYHEGYYEETPPSLSYSANWQHEMNNTVLTNFQNDCMNHQSQFNLNGQVDLNYPPNEMEDSLYLEDTEWYQQWLALLEQGMWWPAEDGDCGYFVYTDHEYIYALLTDAEGEYVYACAPEGELFGDAQIDGLPSAWLHNEMVCVCGFKIPLYNEDELLWLPGQDSCDSQLLNAPLDLSAAYKKGNQIMNLNLEQFSQMFENSFLSQGQQGLDFASYTLNKVRMDPRQSSYVFEDQCKDIIDLSCHNRDRIGPNWNNHEIKTFLAQKVAISLNSTPTAYQNHQLLHSCYQPGQRRRSSTVVTVKHVDDVLEEEWRQRVSPGEEQPNRQVKKISALISSVVGKSSPLELNKTRTSPSDQAPDRSSKNILSSGFQSLKSKIIKEEPTAVVTQPESVKQQVQKPPTMQGRILPTIPTVTSVSQPLVQSHTSSQKPRLSRQSTMVQQATPPQLPNVTVPSGPKEPLIKTGASEQLRPDKPVDTPVETTSEQPQAGFMNFLKSAVGIEEQKLDPQKGPQPSPKQQSKVGSTESTGSGSSTVPSNKEATGVSNLFGSISNLFSAEPPASSKQQMKPSATEGSLTSASRPKGIQRQQTMDQSGVSRPTQSHLPNKSLSQASSPSSAIGPTVSRVETVPPAEQTKHDTETKPTGGLFGFSIGEMLSGSTTAAQSGGTSQTPSAAAPQEESLGKSILSIFSGTGPSQTSPTGPVPQDCPSQKVPQPPQQESLGKSLLSMFGGSSPQQPPQTKPAAEARKQGTVPPKDPPNTGFLSMFGGSTTQQSQGQTGSLLGGILPGSSSSTESPVKGLLSMFSDPSPPQSQPTSFSQQRAAQAQTKQQEGTQTQSRPQAQRQAQEQQATSVLGGLLGGLSTSSEAPRKSLFSMFSGPGTTQSAETSGNANSPSSSATAASKEPAKSIHSVFTDAVAPSQQAPNTSSSIVTSTKDPQSASSQDISSQVSSVSSSTAPVADTPCETSSQIHDTPSAITAVDSTQGPNTEIITERKEVNTQGPSNNAAPSKESPASGILSSITGSSSQAPVSKAEPLSDSPAKGLLSLFSGPSTVDSSPAASAPGSSGPKDTSAKGLFSVLGGSAPQPSPQSGGSLLGAMFGGSSPQSASQTGGSLLGGLFGGSAPQPAPQVGPTKTGGSVPQSGTSLLGGLFGGSAPQTASSQTGGSILGGLFGGSLASNTGPQDSGSIGGIFGATANQTKSSNSSSILGGILGGSSQTATEQTGTSLLGGILTGVSPDKTRDKSVAPVLGGSVTPIPTCTQKSSDDNKALTSSLPDTTTCDKHLPKANDDSKTTPALAASQTSIMDITTQGKVFHKPDTVVQSLEVNVPKADVDVEEVESQKADKTSASANDIQSKQSDICSEAQQPARPELLSSQLGQDSPKIEQETLTVHAESAVVPGQQKSPEPEKPVVDSAADTVTGFVSSLFKPPVASNDGPQQQQKGTLFGLGGTTSQGTTSQGGTSLLGGIFGGTNTETVPQTGVSLLGGLFKGSAPQSGPSTSAPTSGGSILGGMFGGGSTTKTAGPQTGGSLLGGMFGGSVAATAPSGGSLLGGMFGGVTAQTEGPQTGTSVLGGLGGSLFGGVGKQSKPSEPIPSELKSAPGITLPPQNKNETVPPKVSPSGTETSTDTNMDPTPPLKDQNQSSSLGVFSTVASEAVCPETTSVSGGTPSDPNNKIEDTKKEMSPREGETIQEKPLVIKIDPECKEGDKSVPPADQGTNTNVAPSVNLPSHNVDPTQPKSLFGFIPTQSDAGKSLGSILSSAALSTPQTEGGSGLLSGLKTLSGGLFQEDKSVTGKQGPSTTSLFGTKISFPWQSEPPKPQAVPVITSQPQISKPSSGQTGTVQKVSTSDDQKTESVGSTDDITNPQIYISTPEVDPSAPQTSKEEEKVVEISPIAGSTSGVQLDNQSKKELLNAKRLVKA